MVSACSPKVQPPDPESLKPAWLKTTPYSDGYYTGIGHSLKDGSNNYIQSAKKSALDDLVSQIKVNVSSTSVLSQLETNQKFSEQYKQVIQTNCDDETRNLKVGMLGDPTNTGLLWIQARYREIKKHRKTRYNLSLDIRKRRASRTYRDLCCPQYYFQAFVQSKNIVARL